MTNSPDGIGRESRRTVTVLFADVVDSTGLAERLDPEAARAALSRFYEIARRSIERHSGVVEKYIGDAVMGVFGIPALHEDDALRAVRAAVELRDLMAPDNLAIRIGVNTGEVIVGDPAAGTTLVTGDAVNVAARLQALAPQGDILAGRETVLLVRAAASFGPLETFAVKGKTEAVTAARLLAVGPSDTGRRTGGPFVGRAAELTSLGDAFRHAVEERAAALVTIVGPPGSGKSRLVAEFRASTGDTAQFLAGRCLSYGEGITYWPISEIVRAAAGITERDNPAEARARIAAMLADDPEGTTITGRLAAVIGIDSSNAVPEETPWAIRRMLEILASKRPLILLIDDLQWADPALLDLIEYVLGWAQGVPMLVLCVARPEFRERRPDWGDPLTTAQSIRLSGLGEADIGIMLDELAAAPLPAEVRERIVRSSDGNPLFAEELLTMLLEEGHLRPDGDHGWAVTTDLENLALPPSIGALLAARLDRLPADEHMILTRSSVIGEQFDRAAALELADATDREAVPGRLLALVRKELLRPDQSDLLGGEAFRFRHLLFRDAAYAALAKADRAVLHERFAQWLVAATGDRLGEFEAIVGYHYEQAHGYRIALEQRDERTAELARSAALHLGSAGRRSMEIGDMGAAAGTLGRSVELLDRMQPSRFELIGLLSVALTEVGQQIDAREITRQALRDARDLGIERLILHAQVDAGYVFMLGGLNADTGIDDPVVTSGNARQIAARFAELGDLIGEAKAWQLCGLAEWYGNHIASATDAFERGRTLARSAGDRQLERRTLAWGVPFYGAAPVERAIENAQEDLQNAKDDRVRRCEALVDLGLLHSLEGNIVQARAEIAEARGELATLGRRVFHAASCEFDALIELQDGDLARAADALEEGIAELDRLDHNEFVTTDLATLALVRAMLGDMDGATAAIARNRELTPGGDPVEFAFTERARARMSAAEGNYAAAASHALAAVALLTETDLIPHLGDAELDLATFQHMAGDIPNARSSAKRALALCVTKGNVVGRRRAERFLAELPS